MSQIMYEPYHIHTSYSNCQTQPDSTMSIEDYAKVFRERGHQVLCISEHGNRSNVYQQFDLANKYSDDTFRMTPLAAAEVYYVPNRSLELKDDRHFHLILIAKDMTGLKQQNKAISEANMTGFYRYARVDLDIKYVSKQAAEDLYRAGQNAFPSFPDVLRTLQMDTCLNTRQIGVLTSVGYFNKFGGNKTLLELEQEYFEGKNKLTKTLVPKTVEKRLAINRDLAAAATQEPLPIAEQLALENEYVGLCLTEDRSAPHNQFFVLDVDDKFGVKVKLYSVQRGTMGMMRLRKNDYENMPFKPGDCIFVQTGENRPRYSYVNGARKPTGERDYWITDYTCQPGRDVV